ncbi:ras-related protein Rab-37-like isoform X1 [Neocloeon triangulifer]|uniref:ras-related protein Rab-37-like isoform X1 n=1 Tax=Neocloeon triangulifer TaxID=2078957 RepID=UPI00286F73E1|nr:ras-related protein Rab-37-like isoform X1 [Neocloeon triangulifer]
MAMALAFDADNFSDDVFESPDEEEPPTPAGFLSAPHNSALPKAPSPTGYRDYVAPAEAFIPASASAAARNAPVHKTILLGDSGVGKTSLLVQFDTGTFKMGTFSATVGIGFSSKIVTVDEEMVKLQIWDTAGQERFRSVTHAYYRDAHALLLLYDVTNKTSFDNIRAWLGEIREYAQDDVVILLLGNKADCENRKIRREEGERLAREYNVIFLETSAKSGLNVDLAFTAVARELLSRSTLGPDKAAGGDAPFSVHDYVREHSVRVTENAPESNCVNCNI